MPGGSGSGPKDWSARPRSAAEPKRASAKRTRKLDMAQSERRARAYRSLKSSCGTPGLRCEFPILPSSPQGARLVAVVLNAGGRCNCCQLSSPALSMQSARHVSSTRSNGSEALPRNLYRSPVLAEEISTKLETPPGSRTQLIQKANQMSRANKRS